MLILLVLLFPVAHAQTENMPDILKPDRISEAEAARVGAKIFKMLPAEMLYKNSPDESRHDKDFPFGIRGGGAFFSFTNESHSSNRHPELYLRPPRLGSGPGTNLVLSRDLGRIDLLSVENHHPELSYILSYNPPKYLKDVSAESSRLDKENPGGLSGGRLNLRYEIGNAYHISLAPLTSISRI